MSFPDHPKARQIIIFSIVQKLVTLNDSDHRNARDNQNLIFSDYPKAHEKNFSDHPKAREVKVSFSNY